MKMTNVFVNGECVGQVPVPCRQYDGYNIEKTKTGVYVNTDSNESFYILGNKTSWKYIEETAEWLIHRRHEEAPQCVKDFFFQINHYHTNNGEKIDTWVKGRWC